MTFVFESFELDPARRELRVGGKAAALQPQVFDLLVYLVEHRERVVSKRELLESLWPDSVVTESSLQRAVSLARSALGDRGAALIQTFPRQGYRFTGALDDQRASEPPIRLQPKYTKSGDVHIAYTSFGSGDVDIVIVNGWIMPMRGMFHHPVVRATMQELGKIGRVILVDKRGTGLSDRVKSLPSHEQRMDDLRVVLDACGSTESVLVGISEGGALAILYAATYPERVSGLVLAGAFARMTRAPDYPFGYSSGAMEKLRSYIKGGWGKGASLRAIAPSKANDPVFVDWVAFAEQEGTSPGGALDLLDMNLRIDLRELLPSVRVPTAILQASEDGMIDPRSGAYLAEHIPDSRYVEIEGDDHMGFFKGRGAMLGSIRWVLQQERAPIEEDRFLSTALVAVLPDDADQRLWQEHVTHFKGRALARSGYAYFDGPARALQCARRVSAELHARCGVHTGEVVRQGAEVSGPAFEVASEIAGGAAEDEARSSRVVVDLVPGTDLRFDSTDASVVLGDRKIEVFSIASES